MTSFATAGVIVAACAYAMATLVSIRLNRSLTVPIAAALAPAAAASGLASEGGSPWLVLAAPLLGTVTLLAARRDRGQVLSVLTGSLVCVVAMTAIHRVGQPSVYVVLPLAVAATALFANSELIWLMCAGKRGLLGEDKTMWLLLQGVLVCASGLVVLVMESLGLGAFVAMAVVLALTKREFEGFALSRRALDQTVGALEQLALLEAANAGQDSHP